MTPDIHETINRLRELNGRRLERTGVELPHSNPYEK